MAQSADFEAPDQAPNFLKDRSPGGCRTESFLQPCRSPRTSRRLRKCVIVDETTPGNVVWGRREMKINFTGSWNADLSQSRFLGLSPKALSVKIEHADTELVEEVLLTRLDGSEERVVFKCRINGEQDRSFLNGKAVPGSTRWKGEELLIETWLQPGTLARHFCDYWSMSPDGQTLFMEHRDDDLAGQFTVLKRAE